MGQLIHNLMMNPIYIKQFSISNHHHPLSLFPSSFKREIEKEKESVQSLKSHDKVHQIIFEWYRNS